MSWPWMCGAGVSRRAISSLSLQKTEEVSYNIGQLRFGSLQKLWRSSNVLVKQLGAAHSRASYGQRIPHVPSPSPAISAISARAWFNQECGDDEALLTEDSEFFRCFRSEAILECSSSPWFTRLSLSPDSLMDSFGKFKASSFSALAGGSSHLPSSHPSPRADPSVEGSSPMASLSLASPAEGNLDVGYFSWSGLRGVRRWCRWSRAGWVSLGSSPKIVVRWFLGLVVAARCWCWRRVWSV